MPFYGLPGPWISWTPTWANLTIGNAVVDCKYIKVGKLTSFRVAMTLGTTTSVGTNPTFSLPLTSVTVTAAMSNMNMGTANVNTGAGAKNLWLKWASVTTCRIMVWDANNDEGAVTASNPLVWATGHVFAGQGAYENV